MERLRRSTAVKARLLHGEFSQVLTQLAGNGVQVEQWGGDVVSVEVSALKKQGIDDLLDMILLTADILDLKSTPDMPARARAGNPISAFISCRRRSAERAGSNVTAWSTKPC